MTNKSFKDMATRADNAVIGWRNMLFDKGFSNSEADAILQFYIKEKLVKLDWGIGTYNVKHGAFLSKKVLKRALRVA